MSWLCPEGALNEETSMLYCLSNAYVCEVDGVPPGGIVCIVSVFSATVLPVVSLVYSSFA